MTVFRGKKNSLDIGKVIAFDGEPEMDFYDGDECNQFVGTDSTIFAPYMDVKDGIWAYEAAVCRSLGADYVGKSKYKGVVRSAGKPRCKLIFSQTLSMTHSILYYFFYSRRPNSPSILVVNKMHYHAFAEIILMNVQQKVIFLTRPFFNPKPIS